MVIRPVGAPEGYEVKLTGALEPEVSETDRVVTFDPANRGAVDHVSLLASKSVPIGEVVPEITLHSLSGGEVQLQDFRGRVVVIDLWATWCAPCWKALEYAEELGASVKTSGLPVTVLAVSTLERAPTHAEKREHVARFWRSKGFKMETLLDLDGHFLDALGYPGLPSTIVIAPDGTLFRHHLGLSPDMVATLQADVRDALEQQ